MKKSIIAAGASAVALAAMPVVGVFAAGATTGASSYTDNLSITIETACTFARENYASGGIDGNASHKNGSGTWGTGASADTLSATVTNSSLTALGSSNFKVVCNNTAGYQVTVANSGLTSGGNSIPNNNTYTNAISGWSPIYNGTKLVGDTTTPATVKSASTTTDNDTFEVSYSVGVSSTQQAGTYEGSATYTFAQL